MINRQFYTYKFHSSRLKEFNYDINISFDEAKELKEVIALADNQFLRTIRDITKHTIKYDKLERLYKERDLRKRKSCKDFINENSQRIIDIQNKINRTMFIPSYITVVSDHPAHYKKIFENGIIMNGKVYKRLSCSAGQARVSTIVLCDVDIIDIVKDRLNNGRDKTKKVAPSKFNAYFGLAGSATHLVSEPKFIVVKDFINYDKFKANFVIEKDWNIDDDIETRELELEMNRTDGMGLISPQQAEKWAKELSLDWIPSQFCIRQNYVKGMLCTFPIHEFCEEINNANYLVDTIYQDENGSYIKADLRDYDVIITESQFKLWDSYPDVNTYIDNCHNHKLYWGVSQYTPKQAKDILKLNYQFIQTLDLNKKDIEKLAEQFVNWICGISYENVYYMLLFLLGVNHNQHSINKYLQNSDNYWIKSLILNHDLKNDKYIRTKIRELIKIKIQNGCMGDIFVDGNFQVLVYDPYGFMQHVCRQEVTGLLGKGEFYSNYWNEREIKQVDGMRSPLTYRSEHVILNLVKNELTEKWYRYCKLGIILNYHGHEVVNFGGADTDYDILATTSNQQIIKGVYEDELPVVYDPPKPNKIVFTEKDLYEADTFSFGSIIGSITNKSSNGYALLPNLEEQYGKDSQEYQITLSRLKQCCKAQSAQIDKAKIGREVKGIPKLWITKQKINTDENGDVLDSEEEIKKKDMYNSILLTKYPYFFKYLYKDSKRKYNKYYDENEITCHQKFKMSIKGLKEQERLSLEQKQFLDNFYDYMPLTLSNSSMNLLCRYIENINFEINKNINSNCNIDVSVYKNNGREYTQEQYDKVIEILKHHLESIRFNKILPSSDIDEDNKFNETIVEEQNLDNDTLERKMNEYCSDVFLVLNCLIDYYYIHKPNANKDILWNTYGKYMFENIKNNVNAKVLFPFPDEDGEINYLNKKYSLKEIELS